MKTDLTVSAVPVVANVANQGEPITPTDRAQARQARAEAEFRRAQGVAVAEAYPGNRDPLLSGPDLGPAHQRRTRRLEAVHAVDPAQPTGPRIRRARLRDPLRRMVKTQSIAYRLYVGAEEFREDLDRAEGARDQGEALARALSRLATGTPPAPRLPWSRSNDAAHGQWEAQQRIQRAWRDAIGIVAGGVFHWIVISRGTIESYAECKTVRRVDASRMLKDALTRLADFYAIGDVQPPPEWELDAGTANGA